ncbi:MAG: triose-phosphate isomerase [Actinomycetota bacterium]|nr:triose-phosphate isomerase [Actinomycetota bacterium]
MSDALTLVQTVQAALGERARQGRPLPTPIICPPFISLVPLRGLMDRALLRLGAQNCHWEAAGAYTGEISTTMLQDLVDYVMVGHSERRAAGETDDQVARKVAAVVRAGLVPILFVGEQEPTDDASRQSEQQLTEGLSRIDPRNQPVVVVYEPVWAVGAEQAADPEHVRREVERLKEQLGRLGASRPEVIYGGTVNDQNIDQFAELDVLDGVGATRASLDPRRFVDLLDRIATRTGA